MSSPKNPSHLLRRIGDFLGANPFVRHNLTFMTGSLSVAALNYLFYPVLSRMLTPADFGEVQTLTSLFTQAAIFLTILTYVTIHVTVNVSDEQLRNQTLLGLERLAMLVGYALLILALVFVNQLRIFLNFNGTSPFIALIVALAISVPLAFRMAYLRGRKQFARASLTDGISSAGKLLLAPILVLGGLRSFGAMAALALSQILSLAAGIVWARQADFHAVGLGLSRLRSDLLRPYLKHAVAVLIGAGGITLIQTIDIVAIKHYFSATEAGLYAGITTIAGIIFFLMSPVTGVLVTVVSLQQPLRKNQQRLLASLAIMGGLGGLALVAMTIAPHLIISLLVGAKYGKFATYLPLIGLSMLFLGIGSALMMYHIALKKYAYCFASLIVVVVLLGLMAVHHGTIKDVINNIVFGSFLLLIITATQNFYLKITNPGEENA